MNFAAARERMVERDLAGRGISDLAVLNAFREVPREHFVPDHLAEYAYSDGPLPIGHEQTISQPFVVALTVAALRLGGDERVLDVGTGSGYAAAILSRVAGEVYTIERIETLAMSAAERLRSGGFDNVHAVCGDGTLGWAEHAPYEGIAVAAGATEIPPALREQLAPGGRLVIPVGARTVSQVLLRVTREREPGELGESPFAEEPLCPVRFVPLIGNLPDQRN